MDAVALPADEPATTREDVEFYMVWSKRGRPPRKVHGSREKAATEAQRLARTKPGCKFIVLQAVEKFHAPAPANDTAQVAS